MIILKLLEMNLKKRPNLVNPVQVYSFMIRVRLNFVLIKTGVRRGTLPV